MKIKKNECVFLILAIGQLRRILQCTNECSWMLLDTQSHTCFVVVDTVEDRTSLWNPQNILISGLNKELSDYK